jgi:cullin 1
MSRVTEGLDKINDSIVRHVLDYLKTGVFRNKTANAYMVAYSEVHKLADDENDSSKKLFEYYQSTIKKYMQDAQQSMIKERGEKLIELFIRENNQCKILIHWMRKVFTYLDKFYTKNANIGTLCSNGLKLYFMELYIPLKKSLFEAVDKMIEADRNCEVVDRSKIKNLLRVNFM